MIPLKSIKGENIRKWLYASIHNFRVGLWNRYFVNIGIKFRWYNGPLEHHVVRCLICHFFKRRVFPPLSAFNIKTDFPGVHLVSKEDLNKKEKDLFSTMNWIHYCTFWSLIFFPQMSLYEKGCCNQNNNDSMWTM